jgi:hypothetical protein
LAYAMDPQTIKPAKNIEFVKSIEDNRRFRFSIGFLPYRL